MFSYIDITIFRILFIVSKNNFSDALEIRIIIGFKRKNRTINWPANSPDLNYCDYWLWGYLKDRVYANNTQTIIEHNISNLENNISNKIKAISDEMNFNAIKHFESQLCHVIEVVTLKISSNKF